jgi:hypothetical protein
MKKLIVLFAIMLVTSNLLFAQLTFGPKIGYTASTLTTDWSTIKEEANGSKMHFGFFLRSGGEKVYVQPEINFITKSGTLRSDLTGAVIDHTLDLNSIDIPVLVGYNIINMDAVKVRAFAGPVASLYINSKETIDGGTAQEIFTEENFKAASWNLNFGAGVDLLMFTLDIRYDYGLTNIFEGSVDDFDLKNRAFLVSLGWKIR